jgi:hypothetical protein
LVKLVGCGRDAVSKKQDGADFSIQVLRVEIMGFERFNFRDYFGFCTDV